MIEQLLANIEKYITISEILFFTIGFSLGYLPNKYRKKWKRKRAIRKRKTYLIYDPISKLTKIGFSNKPEQRIKAINTGNPFAKIVAIHKDDLESKLHLKYKKYRVKKEWFQISYEQRRNIIKTYGFKSYKE